MFTLNFSLSSPSGDMYSSDRYGRHTYCGDETYTSISELIEAIKDIANEGYIHDLDSTGSPGLIYGVIFDEGEYDDDDDDGVKDCGMVIRIKAGAPLKDPYKYYYLLEELNSKIWYLLYKDTDSEYLNKIKILESILAIIKGLH